MRFVRASCSNNPLGGGPPTSSRADLRIPSSAALLVKKIKPKVLVPSDHTRQMRRPQAGQDATEMDRAYSSQGHPLLHPKSELYSILIVYV